MAITAFHVLDHIIVCTRFLRRSINIIKTIENLTEEIANNLRRSIMAAIILILIIQHWFILEKVSNLYDDLESPYNYVLIGCVERLQVKIASSVILGLHCSITHSRKENEEQK